MFKNKDREKARAWVLSTKILRSEKFSEKLRKF
jgi:hypothetical protein